ncbi:MAG TPA: Xaa-Pro peptidase family protein [Terriglobales bacterium]|nr:Xaa-Pro peptidase family protein [Terriglobales bacterium]
MDHVGRLRRLRQIVGQDFDALLISHLPNIRYLCGFTGSTAVLIVTANKAVLITDGRYTLQARAEVRGARVVISRKGAFAAAAEWLGSNFGKSSVMGIEGEHLTVAAREQFRKLLPEGLRVRNAPDYVRQARMVKDEDEIASLKNAVLLAAKLFDTAVETIRPGVKEVEVAAEMEYAARCAGAEGMSFETIVASGQRSALPHGRASQAAIPRSGFVVCDFGVILSGYCSDMTRTVHVGRPSGEAQRIYGAVREAQEAGVAAVAPGVTAAEVDGAARKVLQKAGFGRFFTHSTGHGVGLEIHEPPRVATGRNEVLQPGMVITIEPGAYIPGKWGVRIEDMVVVAERGCEVLTPTRKELISL